MDDRPDNPITTISDLACGRCGHLLRGVQATVKCPECGEAVQRSNDPKSKLAWLTTTLDHWQANQIKAMLEANDIRATVMGERVDVGVIVIPLASHALPSVWVFRDDLAVALALLKDFSDRCRNLDPEDLSQWQCPSCDELVDGHFDLCWNCGSPNNDQSTDQPSPH